MKPEIFSRIAESLRQYRRAELRDFEVELGSAPVDTLYVDPLPNNAILNSVLSSLSFLVSVHPEMRYFLQGQGRRRF